MTEARARLEHAWRRSDALFALLAPGALGERPLPSRPPFVFLLGHLPAFAWGRIARDATLRPPLDPALEALFGGDGHAAAWPPLEAILAFRDRVRSELRTAVDARPAAIDDRPAAIDDRPAAGDDRAAAGASVVDLVVEHELTLQETLLQMLQQTPARRKVRRADLPGPRGGAGLPPTTIAVPAGRAGGDEDVPAFGIDSVPVRNADFLAFVEDGGYPRDDVWNADNGAWRTRAGLSHPLGWISRDGAWFVRTLFEDVPFDDAAGWPASVSLAEARAYARWRGARLPTEAELVRAAYGDRDGGSRAYPWGDAEPAPARGSFDFADWSPTPVGSHPLGASAWGAHEIVGNGWEWTDTPLSSGAGSGFVLLGGSWATARALLRRGFRNGAGAHDPFVFAKFRCVRTA